MVFNLHQGKKNKKFGCQDVKKLSLLHRVLNIKNNIINDAFCKSTAFTLAEVLITLGIIGVVAALTMPVLIAKHQIIVLHTQFKKAYSILANISLQFYLNENMSINQYFNEFHDLTEIQVIYNKYLGPLEPVSESYTIKNLGGNTESAYPRLKYFNPKMGLIFYLSESAYFNNKVTDAPIISVDTNGYKKPNTLGIDIFTFIFDENGKLLPYGTKDYRELGWALPYWYGAASCTSNSSRSCAYYAFANIHPTDSNKDYWNDFLFQFK